MRGKGLGADMLADALRRIAAASRSIGVAAALVHANDDAAKRFYLKCAEFIEYPQESRTLFLPIKTVFAAFSSLRGGLLNLAKIICVTHYKICYLKDHSCALAVGRSIYVII